MHWFLDPVKDKYIDFTGRATRQEFWMFVLIYFIIHLVLSIVYDPLAVLFGLAILLPAIAITTRRLHDTGLSGWWQLIGLIPVLGIIIVVVLCVREGEQTENEFGPAPIGEAAPEATVQDAEVVSEMPIEETEQESAPESIEAPTEENK